MLEVLESENFGNCSFLAEWCRSDQRNVDLGGDGSVGGEGDVALLFINDVRLLW